MSATGSAATQFKRGAPGGPRAGVGRPKGIPNKLHSDVKAMLLAALNKAGGVDYLAARALDQPVAFMSLIGKVLPLQVTGANGGALHVDFRWADAPANIVSDETNKVASVTIDAEPDLVEWETPKLAND